MALQDDIAGISKFLKQFDSLNKFNIVNKSMKSLTSSLTFPTVAKEVSSFYDKNAKLLTQISPSQLSAFHELVNPFKSILDNKILGYSDFSVITDKISIVSPALSALNQYFNFAIV